MVSASAIKIHDPSQRWDRKVLNDMQGSPQQPVPGKLGLHIPIRVRLDPPVYVEPPVKRAAREEEVPKGAYLKIHYFDLHLRYNYFYFHYYNNLQENLTTWNFA